MESIEDKQNYLRSEIIDKGYSPDDFFLFLSDLKEGEINLQDWYMNELRDVVNQYKSKVLKSNSENIEQKDEKLNEIKQEKIEPIINENSEKNEKEINLNKGNNDIFDNNDMIITIIIMIIMIIITIIIIMIIIMIMIIITKSIILKIII